jgi:hypothetical protein
MTDGGIICEAIRQRRLLAFDYKGLRRRVAPYCHGLSRRGEEVLRGVQVGGPSRTGGLGFGKLWLVSEMKNLRCTDERFAPSDPDYNPNDSAMVEIHCHV